MLFKIQYKWITQIYLQSIEHTRIICRHIDRHIEHFIHYVTLFKCRFGPPIRATLMTVASLACITVTKATSVDRRPARHYCTCPTIRPVAHRLKCLVAITPPRVRLHAYLIACMAHCSCALAYTASSTSSYSPNGINLVTKNHATWDPKSLAIGFGRFWP